MELIAIWLFFGALVGWVATTKGRSGVGWFLLAVLISPLIAGIIILVMGPAKPQAPIVGVADELQKLAALRDNGTITEAEFQRQRAALLPTETKDRAPDTGYFGRR